MKNIYINQFKHYEDIDCFRFVRTKQFAELRLYSGTLLPFRLSIIRE